jgi:hypothetical protein
MGGLQNRDAARRFASGKRELIKHLADDCGRAAARAADDARRRILAAESRHPGPLRAQIAGTVTVRGQATSDGYDATITSDGYKMPPGAQNLPAYANAGSARWQRWRHPVYGNREVWVSQDWPSARGWFDGATSAAAFTRAVSDAVDETARYLEG